jgi:hypothetical protein
MPTVSSLGAALITPDPVDPDNAYYNGGIAHNSEGAMYVVGGAGNQIPYVLAQSAIPYGIANSGTVAVNGTYTAGTAYNTTYSGGIYLYFPATAFATAAAGFYWCVASSTTAFTVYTDSSATTPVTGSNVAFTGDTTARTAITATIPAGAIGANGSVDVRTSFSANSTAGTKNSIIRYDSTTILTQASASNSTSNAGGRIYNRNSESLQRTQSYVSGTAGGSFTSVDTSVSVSFNIQIQITVATDVFVMESYTVMILPGA